MSGEKEVTRQPTKQCMRSRGLPLDPEIRLNMRACEKVREFLLFRDDVWVSEGIVTLL